MNKKQIAIEFCMLFTEQRIASVDKAIDRTRGLIEAGVEVAQIGIEYIEDDEYDIACGRQDAWDSYYFSKESRDC